MRAWRVAAVSVGCALGGAGVHEACVRAVWGSPVLAVCQVVQERRVGCPHIYVHGSWVLLWGSWGSLWESVG